MTETLQEKLKKAIESGRAKFSHGEKAQSEIEPTAKEFLDAANMIISPIMAQAEKCLLQEKFEAQWHHKDISALKSQFKEHDSYGLYVKLSRSYEFLGSQKYLGWHFIAFCCSDKNKKITVVECEPHAVQPVPVILKLEDLTSERVEKLITEFVVRQTERWPVTSG